ncbi:uncharacterized protein [Pyxicephalus adspersus]|uniref:uncharacterized protein isoform X2 n=1 Tax=Pyxicephalus adspersus TaxID=30357 RepID=UPI003B58E8FA
MLHNIFWGLTSVEPLNMSHTAEEGLDQISKYFKSKKNGNKLDKSGFLIKFIEDPNRIEPLVGLQYVVEIKNLETHESIVRCNICRVKGHIKTMMEHLIGLHHIKAYMEMYYFTELQSIKHSDNKSKIPELIKDFAREIERAEGTQNLQIECFSAPHMKRESDNWISLNDGNSMFISQQTESSILDRRLMALKYSETFKITSRAEASVVLKLTQHLSDSLEQYFMNCEGFEVLDSGVVDNTHEIFQSSTKILFSSDYENRTLESTAERQFNINPTLSVCTSTNIHSLDGPFEKPEIATGENQTCDVISSKQDVFPKKNSSSGLQNRKLQNSEDPADIPFMSSQSITPQPVQVEHSSCVYQNNISNGKVAKAISESKLPVVYLGMENNESDLDASSMHSTNLQETPSTSQPQRKTSKTLSPDILQLLKGKDANTVTNILKTLSPFYPALQDVNLEILAQVLVNTGALD